MTPPPTNIDGTDITGATIDGTEVTEITVDGDTVFTAGPTIDNFEQSLYGNQGKTLSDFYGGNLSTATRQQSVVFEGSFALEVDSGNGSIGGDGSEGLPNYPVSGDSFRWRILLEQGLGTRAGTSFGQQSSGDWFSTGAIATYIAVLDKESDKVQIWKDNVGTKLATTSVSIPEGEWLECQVDWGSGGSINFTVFNSSGFEIASISGNDSEYTSGGVGYGVQAGGANIAYWDIVEIL
jgi:hypothetical protein